MMNDQNVNPVEELRLPEFLQMLEKEYANYCGGGKLRLHKMLSQGLKIYDLAGLEGLYSEFEESARVDDFPIAIKLYAKCARLSVVSLLGPVVQGEVIQLGGLFAWATGYGQCSAGS